MSDLYFVSILLIFIPIIISRFIMESAQKKLDNETRLLLLDQFSGQRKYSAMILVAILLLFYLFYKFSPGNFGAYMFVYPVLIIGLYLYYTFRNLRKLKALNVPGQYVRAVRISRLIIGTGLLAYGATFFFQYNHSRGKQNAYQYARMGYDALEKKSYQEALSDYNQALLLDNSVSTYYTNRGSAKFGMGDHNGACADWSKARSMGDSSAAMNLRYFCH